MSDSFPTQQILAECRRSGTRPTDVQRLTSLLDDWLGTIRQRAATVDFARECLAWCRLHSRLVPGEPARADELIRELTAWVESPPNNLPDDPLPQQLLSAELPLTMAATFGSDTVEPARESLAVALRELLDLDGVPHARWLRVMNELLACWNRCDELGRELQADLFVGEARTALDGLRRIWPSFCRSDGVAMLSAMNASPKRISIAKRTETFGTHSEWGGVAVLQADASADSPRLLIDFSGPTLRTELLSRREILWHGDWPVEIAVDGQPLRGQSIWHSLCWVADEDVDYLELQQEFTGGWKAQRQIVIGRRDQFLYAADAVVGPEPVSRIEYRSVVPLVPTVKTTQPPETNEVLLSGRRHLGCLVPLALPEWRSDTRLGALRPVEGGWELRQAAAGRALYAPLFLDLQRRRANRSEVTWRHLSVGERFVSQPRDVAVGFRVQHADGQWLFYRSLGAKMERTVLGQHIAHEFLSGRVESDGTVKRLIEIE